MSSRSGYIFEVRDEDLVRYTPEQHGRYHELFNKYVMPAAIGVGLLTAAFCAKLLGVASGEAFQAIDTGIICTIGTLLPSFMNAAITAQVGEMIVSSKARNGEESLYIPNASDRHIMDFANTSNPQFATNVRRESRSQIAQSRNTTNTMVVATAINLM